MLLYFKSYESDSGLIIALCDKDVIGKKYTDKKTGLVLDLDKYADFYKGELVTADDAFKDLSQGFFSANIVGKTAVKIAIDAGFASEGEIKTVEKVPFVQIFKVA